MAKLGRPPFKITPEVIAKVEALAAQGLTQEQLATVIGCNVSTLYEKKRAFKEFSDAIERGKAKGIATVSNALFKSAQNGNLGAQVFYLKNRAGWTDKVESDVNLHVSHDDWLDSLE